MMPLLSCRTSTGLAAATLLTLLTATGCRVGFEPVVGQAACGNGSLDPSADGASAEQCDDGNLSDGDGCSASCVVEVGWRCEGAPSTCDVICGDGVVVAPIEACDVGNQSGMEGCTADCSTVSDGWSCAYDDMLGRSVCTLIGCADTGSEPERCDGIDNDCDGKTDEQLQRPCGTCGIGTQFCMDGQWSDCLGDTSDPSDSCGNGPATSCEGGPTTIPAPCNPLCSDAIDLDLCQTGECLVDAISTAEVCGDDVDNDCDGVVDEDCGSCVWVGNESAGADGDGTREAPYDTVQKAIDEATKLGAMVCVLCGQFEGQFTMSPGVHVVGGFGESGGCERSELLAKNSVMVTFPADVGNTPTVLSGFELGLTVDEPGKTLAAIVAYAPGARMVDLEVSVSGNGPSIEPLYAIRLESADTTPEGAAVVARTRVSTAGYSDAVAISSVGLPLELVEMCDTPTNDSRRCEQSCSGSGYGVFVDGGGLGDALTGVHLEDAPGSRLDQVNVCVQEGQSAKGIAVEGNTLGTQITRSAVVAESVTGLAVGIHMESCAQTSPLIAYNGPITAQSENAGVGVQVLSGCNARIEHNERIVGQGGSGFSATVNAFGVGVRCGLQAINDLEFDLGGSLGATGLAADCRIMGNDLIMGAGTGRDDLDFAAGVVCQRGCDLIAGNTLLGTLAAVRGSAGVWLRETTSTLVDRNVIIGGCGSGQSTGVVTVDAQARVANNLIGGPAEEFGGCGAASDAQRPKYAGVKVLMGSGVHPYDIHGNFLTAGASNDSCEGAALVFEELSAFAGDGNSGVRVGAVRNNVFAQSACDADVLVRQSPESWEPEFFSHNLFVSKGPLFQTSTGELLWEVGELRELFGLSYVANTAVEFDAGGALAIFSESAIQDSVIDTGISKGVLPWDLFASPRPLGEQHNRGPFEFDQAGMASTDWGVF